MFENFKKRKLVQLSDQTIQELTSEFQKAKQSYALLGSSELYKFLVEYFEAKIEINRDRIELLDPYKEAEKPKIAQAILENKVMREFITDINDMQEILKAES